MKSWTSTGSKMFCAGQNILSQSKNLIAFSASSKHFELSQKQNIPNGNCFFGVAQNVYRFLVRPKIFCDL